jgi:hypothetical protein
MNNGTYSGFSTQTSLTGVQYWEYTSSGTWQKPANCTRIKVVLVGAGCGGQAGSTATQGGKGGPGGSITDIEFNAKDVQNFVTIIVPAGTIGGQTNGANGTDGGYAGFFHFNGIVTNQPTTGLIGYYASGGSNSGSLGRSNNYYQHTNSTGGTGALPGANGVEGSLIAIQHWNPTSGGGGGAYSAGIGATSGGSSSLGNNFFNYPIASGGAAGVNGQNGYDVANDLSRMLGIGIGGGGGGGHATTAGNGGSGGFPGGGGGGGGGSAGFGKGGNGGNGVVRIWAW